MSEARTADETGFERGIETKSFERTAGGVLAIGSLAMLVGGLLHPPSVSAPSVISGAMTRWLASHWIIAGGVFLVGLGSLLVVFSRSDVTASRVSLMAWSGVALGSLPVVVFMIGEATVLPELAAGGGSAEFATWRAFIEMGVIASLLPVTVGLILVAATQARARSTRTPTWVAWGGAVAFLVGLVWIVGFGFLDIAALEPVFVVELLGFIWLGWLGYDLTKSAEGSGEARTAAPETSD